MDGGKYGMKLNKDKCDALSDGTSEPIQFMNGEIVNRKQTSSI